MGIRLERLALVPDPGQQWPVVVAALLDSFDVVLLKPPARVRQGDARRLMARTRERGSVLVVKESPATPWPERAELRLTVDGGDWRGLRAGFGHLVSRVLEVSSTGRGAAGRPRHVRLLLPYARGRLAALPEVAAVTAAPGAGVPYDPDAGASPAELVS
jgi:hypothetical protein